MIEFMDTFVDSDFVDLIVSMAPIVGGGFLLGVIVGIIGWVWGFVVRLGRIEY